MKNQNDSGFTLIEFLIGAGLCSLVVFLSYRLILNIRKVELSADDKLKARSFAMTIENGIDCRRLSPNCKEGELLTLYSKLGLVLVNPDLKGKSGLVTRAVCEANSSFRVDVLKVNPNGTIGKDALTGGLLGRDQPFLTIIEAGSLCKVREASQVSPEAFLTQHGKSCFVYSQNALPCSPAPAPDCPGGYTETGMILDTFGGHAEDGNTLFGQHYKRYCIKKSP